MTKFITAILLISLSVYTSGQWTRVKGVQTSAIVPVWGEFQVASANNTPGSRGYQVSWVDSMNHLWLYGGYDNVSDYGDIWKFDGANWAWMYPNDTNRIIDAPPIYPSNVTSPGSRYGSATWVTDDGSIWIYGGQARGKNAYPFYADMWRLRYEPEISWDFIGGSGLVNLTGSWPEKGVETTTGYPGSRSQLGGNWVDDDGNLVLFGGYGTGKRKGAMNDLWLFNVTSYLWTFLGGTNETRNGGYYGNQGVPDVNTWPAARYGGISWYHKGKAFIFGGLIAFPSSMPNDLFSYSDGMWTWWSGGATGAGGSSVGIGQFDPSNSPGSRVYTSGCIDHNRLLVVGGLGFVNGGGGSNRDVWAWDTELNMWAKMYEMSPGNKEEAQLESDSAIMPFARGLSTFVLMKSSPFAYLYGGNEFGGIWFGDLWIVDTSRLNASGIDFTTTSSSSTTGDLIVASPSSSSNSTIIAIAIVIPLFFVLLAIMLLAFFLWRRRNKKTDDSPVVEMKATSVPGSARMSRESAIYDVLDRKSVTLASPLQNVEVGKLLGSGNFGEVFAGTHENCAVALKKLKSAEQFAEFHKEVEFLWALDAASGMSYLHESNVIHRDLALRNLLACDVEDSDLFKFKVKVSDFGMAKTLGDQDYYKSDSRNHPIKWIPIETLKFGKYSTQSDCWSFGILLWELFSYGCAPYPDMTNSEAAEKVITGYRLGKPEGCPEEIFLLMQKCWQEKPKDRPTMKEIEEAINRVIESDE